MGGQKFHLAAGASIIVLGLPGTLAAQSVVPSPVLETGSSSSQRSTQRIVSFTVPLVTETRAYGDVLIAVSENGAKVSVQTDDLQRELDPILNKEGRAALIRLIGDRAFVSLQELDSGGVSLRFDTSQLELFIAGIPPAYRSLRPLIPSRESGERTELSRYEPARFSSYLNAVGNFTYSTNSGADTPELFLSGATRIGGFVAEYDGAFTDQFGESYQFARRSTRLVYDDPASYRRYSAGDLRLESLSILTAPQIAGLGLEKRRRIFDPGFSTLRLGGRQIFLDNRSTVDIRVNGETLETLQLEAGAYDLSTLPIRQGSNDIELVIRDSFGREEVISYDFFFESLPLLTSEEEYSLGIGVLAENFGFEPNYTGELAASGLYRRALSENLILGAALQVSEDVQVIGGSVVSVPQFIPGVIEFEFAGSRTSSQTGVALRAGYRYTGAGSLFQADQLAVNFSYESAGFTNLNNLFPVDFNLLSVTGTYTRSFGPDTVATVGGSYFTGGRFGDDYALFADVSYRLNDRLRLTGGIEYGRDTDFRGGFGVRLGIALALGQGARAAADYRSRFESFRANLSNGADNDVGSFGYDIGFSKFADDTRADAQIEYEANRFSSRIDLASRGDSFGSITDEQRVRIQIGTAVAIAGGQFGIGRPISDSFLLAKPNSAIADQDLITGRSIRSGDYHARSGPLGSALQGDLAAYSSQNVQFDAADPDAGFDVGDGTVLVEPPYKSGYAVVAGDENYVSVIGTLFDENGPVQVASGRIVDAETGKAVDGSPFFTNSAGRFGLFGLAPGKSYRIELNQSGRAFVVNIPDDASPIIRMERITLPSGQ